MRKILLLFVMILLIALTLNIVINGIQIGNFKIYSYNQIKQANVEIDKEIEKVSVLTSITYPEKISELNSSSKKLITVKEQYNDKIVYSTPEEIQKAKQFSEFKLSFLTIKLGNYATQNGIDLALQYVSTDTSENGDLHFIVTGKYYPISQFVRNIEDDQDLYFKIENFVLVPNTSTEILKAEFDVKGISLDVDNTITNSTITDDTTTDEDGEETEEETQTDDSVSEDTQTDDSVSEDTQTDDSVSEDTTADDTNNIEN